MCIIVSQVSDICPKDYPEYVNITVFASNGQNITFSEGLFPVYVSESSIINLHEAFILDPNKKYSAKIFFQNPNGDINSSGVVNFSEWLCYIQLFTYSIHVPQFKKCIFFLLKSIIHVPL